VCNLQQEANPAATLYSYVNRIGAVTITRAALPQLARDLCVRDRDMASLIAQMAQRGQMMEVGNVLQFSARRQCVVKLGDFFPRYLRDMKVAARAWHHSLPNPLRYSRRRKHARIG
jgi:hypothetical protein